MFAVSMCLSVGGAVCGRSEGDRKRGCQEDSLREDGRWPGRWGGIGEGRGLREEAAVGTRLHYNKGLRMVYRALRCGCACGAGAAGGRRAEFRLDSNRRGLGRCEEGSARQPPHPYST